MGAATGDRLKLYSGRNTGPTDKLVTLLVATILSLASIVLMLSCASREFTWDEADYLANTTHSWGYLWGLFSDNRHHHGPLATDLAKLGIDLLPAWAGSLENRLRFFEALAGSLAVGFLYWTLRRHFKTSRAGALVGSGLLLFSVIRLEETNAIGPHHLMLVCTLAIAAFGYRWRDRPSPRAGVALGAAMALGALSMSYVIPAAFCWAVAVSLAGAQWFVRERTHFKVSWAVPVMLATTAIIVAALWPPGVFRMTVIQDFWAYLHWGAVATLVGDRIFEVTPRWAVAYWLGRLEAPLLVSSAAIIFLALWKALRRGSLSSRHAWVIIFVAFFLATALEAHIAGARNLLQFVGVLCLAVGVLFDEVFGSRAPMLRSGAAVAIIVLAALNLAWLSRSSTYKSFLATDGYEQFLKENGSRLSESARALVFGSPVLNFYAREQGASVAWNVDEMQWTTQAIASLPADVKYVLIPAYVWNNMPPEQPMRGIVAARWKVVWSFQADHAWELRLYQNPQLP